MPLFFRESAITHPFVGLMLLSIGVWVVLTSAATKFEYRAVTDLLARTDIVD